MLILFHVLFSMLLLDIYAVFVTVFPLNAPCTTFTSKVNAGMSSVCHVASIVCSFGHTTPCVMLRAAWTQILVWFHDIVEISTAPFMLDILLISAPLAMSQPLFTTGYMV